MAKRDASATVWRIAERSARGTAYHEAGHAVVAVVLRMPVEWASARADLEDQCMGQVNLRPSWVLSLQWESGIRKRTAYATQSLAGVMAATLWRRGRAASFDELRAERHDWGNVVDAALSVHGPNCDAAAFFRRARLRAERILRAHWPAVRRVARELHRCAAQPSTAQVSGARIRALVRCEPCRSE